MPGGASDRRILITGASGQVGEALTRTLASLGKVVAPARTELDLADAESIRRAVRQVQPRWIVNAGAYTAVDKAESEQELALAINAVAPKILADEAKACSAALIHFSTDYVFNGAKSTPYVESDDTGPLNFYGSSKLAGEVALAGAEVPHFIFRTSWVYGETGKNFLLSILRFARERDNLRIVADQHGAPTWSFDLARMTAHVVGQAERRAGEMNCSIADAVRPVCGVYHAGGAGETTWFEFAAEAIKRTAERKPEVRLASVEPITTSEYPTPASRPLNSRLDTSKLERVFGWKMMEWRDSLAAVLGHIDCGDEKVER